MSIEEFVWNDEMFKMDPNGPYMFDNWKGFLLDGCMWGSIPRIRFSSEVNSGIDRMKNNLEILTQGTAHNASKKNKLAIQNLPMRSACFGTHQLMTAFSGMPLIYKEGFVLKYGPAYMLKRGQKTKIKLNPENNVLMDWNNPRGKTVQTLTIFYHGWCVDQRTGQVVDVTAGQHNGLRDGFIVPLIWKSYGNNASSSQKITSKWWKDHWALDRHYVSMTKRKTKRKALAEGCSIHDAYSPAGWLKRGRHRPEWMPMNDLGYSRNAPYRGLHRILPKLNNKQSVLRAINFHPQMIKNYDARAVTLHAMAIMRLFWNSKRHARLQSPIIWQERQETFVEPTKPLFNTMQIYKDALAA